MIERKGGKTYIKVSGKDASNIFPTLTTTPSLEETRPMADEQSIDSNFAQQDKSLASPKRKKNTRSPSILCEQCGTEAPRTGPSQRYCPKCSEERCAERQRKWANQHPPSPEYVKGIGNNKRSRLRELGAVKSEEHRLTTDAIFQTWTPSAWFLKLRVPFSYAASKNHSMSMIGGGHVFLRKNSREYRQRVTDEVSFACRGKPIVTGKVWIELIIQKPNHRGDAINILDMMADAIKHGLGVDDRWFSYSRVDWQVIKTDPEVLIGIGQDATEPCRVCSYCGQVKVLALFNRNKGMPEGYSRHCLECARTGKRRGISKLQPDDVRAIRAAVALGEPTASITARYNVCPNTIRAIITGKTWKDVM